MIEENFSTGEFTAGIVYLVVAARVFGRGLRNGEKVERLLAAAFLFCGLSSVIYAMASLFRFESIVTAVNFSARIIYVPTAVLIAMFTRLVFRKDESWATGLVWASLALSAIGISGSIVFRGDWEGFTASSPWFWVEWLGFTFPFAWACTEAMMQFVRARKRLRIGLVEPLICNRFLLWALFGGFQVVAYLVLFPQYSRYTTENNLAGMWDMVYSGFLISSIVAVWLVFFPPVVYQRWIEARGHATNQATS